MASARNTGEHPLVRARWVTLALFAALCAWLIPGVGRLAHDDDVLAFLPPDHQDVQAFLDVAERFGMLEVALVGVGSPDEGDLLSGERVEALRQMATRIGEEAGVRLVLSFVDLPDPQITEDGLEVAALVPVGLNDDAEIRRRVLANTDAVGSLISDDGRAAAVLVYLIHAEGPERVTQRRTALESIQRVARESWEGPVHFGGGPFAEYEAAESSRRDIQRLSPIVIGVLALASALLLGSLGAAMLNLIIALLAVGLVVGAHGVFEEPLTIVSSTIPVMMVALGGAFGVHMLAGYQRQVGTSRERASATLRELTLPVVLSGLTTSVAFFALMVMPQVPMQRFGLVAGIGMLVLLLLALVVLPALLSVLPSRALPSRGERGLPLRWRPPAWALVAAAAGCAVVGLGLRADPDTNNVFDENSAPRQANAFFDKHFGGSAYLQVALETDLGEPVVLRQIRDLADELRGLDGVIDVRTLVEPVQVLTEALGGRRGVPETPGRASRVLTYLADHPAMGQLMTPDRRAAIVHVKLAPLDGDAQVRLTEQVRARVDAFAPDGVLRVGEASEATTAETRREAVRTRLGALLGNEVSRADFDAATAEGQPDAKLLDSARVLRDRALDSEDSPVEGVPREEVETITPAEVLTARGEALKTLLRERLPSLVAKDPEGVRFVAEHLGPWMDEAIGKWRVRQRCQALGIPPDAPVEAAPPAEDEMAALFAEPAAEPEMSAACKDLSGTLSELEDAEWLMPRGAETTPLREIPTTARLTGQPVLGQAFGDSVTENLRDSTLVSVAALAIVLLLSRNLAALVPAVWTLALTAAALRLLGQPISIGTSMVACIALGAGVDFAIHLGVRARRIGGPDAGTAAVNQIGVVVLISGVTLGLAFLVLLASDMPPLRDFGSGLAIGLVGAALGAVWWIPVLARARSTRR